MSNGILINQSIEKIYSELSKNEYEAEILTIANATHLICLLKYSNVKIATVSLEHVHLQEDTQVN